MYVTRLFINTYVQRCSTGTTCRTGIGCWCVFSLSRNYILIQQLSLKCCSQTSRSSSPKLEIIPLPMAGLAIYGNVSIKRMEDRSTLVCDPFLPPSWVDRPAGCSEIITCICFWHRWWNDEEKVYSKYLNEDPGLWWISNLTICRGYDAKLIRAQESNIEISCPCMVTRLLLAHSWPLSPLGQRTETCQPTWHVRMRVFPLLGDSKLSVLGCGATDRKLMPMSAQRCRGWFTIS